MIDVADALSKSWGSVYPDKSTNWNMERPFANLKEGALARAIYGGELWPEIRHREHRKIQIEVASAVGVSDKWIREILKDQKRAKHDMAQAIFAFMVEKHMKTLGIMQRYYSEEQASENVAYVLCGGTPRRLLVYQMRNAARALLAGAEDYLFDDELMDAAVAVSIVSASLAAKAAMTSDRIGSEKHAGYVELAKALSQAVQVASSDDTSGYGKSYKRLRDANKAYSDSRTGYEADRKLPGRDV